jgi:hypothetical protein
MIPGFPKSQYQFPKSRYQNLSLHKGLLINSIEKYNLKLAQLYDSSLSKVKKHEKALKTALFLNFYGFFWE